VKVLTAYNVDVDPESRYDIPPLIRWLEHTFCRKPSRLPLLHTRAGPTDRPLRDGMTVVIIGGGIAGPLFARQLLTHTRETGVNVRVVILDHVDCNYCAGLMTSLARETLTSVCSLDIPREVILNEINGCVFINRAGSTSVNVNSTLVSMLRTDRFGEAGFDNSLKYQLLSGIESERERFEIIEPVTVSEVRAPTADAPGWVSFRQHRERRRLEADVLVMASGLRSLDHPMMDSFIAQTGFVRPRTMTAGVTEIDASNARANNLNGKALIVDNIIPDCMVGIIPKRLTWITVSSLHRRLDRNEVAALFAHPEVKRWIDIPDPQTHLRCNAICPALVCLSPGRKICGDGWLVIGDLAGYGRVLKDGYFACMIGASLAAQALAFSGSSARALDRNYVDPLARTFSPRDNRTGAFLFDFNERLARAGWFPPALMEAARAEEHTRPYGGLIHTSLRALLTGEISYTTLTAILVAGLAKYYAIHPGRLIKHLLKHS
jgi:flavin-dependent dehydrogenase